MEELPKKALLNENMMHTVHKLFQVSYQSRPAPDCWARAMLFAFCKSGDRARTDN